MSPLGSTMKKMLASSSRIRSSSLSFLRSEIRSPSSYDTADSDEEDLPAWQVSQSKFSFRPSRRGRRDLSLSSCTRQKATDSANGTASSSTDLHINMADLRKSTDLCGRKFCDPKLRESLADVRTTAPEFRAQLAAAEVRGCISRKGRERLQKEFKAVNGCMDCPGVPESVDA